MVTDGTRFVNHSQTERKLREMIFMLQLWKGIAVAIPLVTLQLKQELIFLALGHLSTTALYARKQHLDSPG